MVKNPLRKGVADRSSRAAPKERQSPQNEYFDELVKYLTLDPLRGVALGYTNACGFCTPIF